MFDLLKSIRCRWQFANARKNGGLSEPLVLMGRGSGRLCYQHPYDASLCIKLPRNGRGKTESRVEYRYMKLIKLFHNENTDGRITPFHGRICTTEGIGWVSQLAMNESTDGLDNNDKASPSIAPQLHTCFTPNAYAAEPANWQAAFDDFIQWRLNTAVVVRDASINNICVKRLIDGKLRFILIDGIGPKGTVPRWLPLKAYAQKRNRAQVGKGEFNSIENLLEFCSQYREDPLFHKDKLVEEPTNPVLCYAHSHE